MLHVLNHEVLAVIIDICVRSKKMTKKYDSFFYRTHLSPPVRNMWPVLLGIKHSNMRWYSRVKPAGRSLGLLRLFNEHFLGNEKLFD